MRFTISMLMAAAAALLAGPAAAQGSAAAGAISFHNHCDGCHTLDPREGDGEGPNLDTIMGRKAGVVAGFEYSRAIRESGIVWNPDTITQFVADPAAMVPGNKMSAVHFKGIPAVEVPDLIAYLQSKQVTPEQAAAIAAGTAPPLPSAPPAAPVAPDAAAPAPVPPAANQ